MIGTVIVDLMVKFLSWLESSMVGPVFPRAKRGFQLAIATFVRAYWKPQVPERA